MSARPTQGPEIFGRKPYVVLVLSPDEARNVAYALGFQDAACQEILDWADEAEQMVEDDR